MPIGPAQLVFGIRSSILYEYLLRTPPWKAYQNICRIFGDHVEFEYFDYWYMMFSRGNYCLRDKAETYSTKNLDNLPVELLEKIVREVSWQDIKALFWIKRFHHIVKSAKLKYEKCEVSRLNGKVVVNIDGEVKIIESPKNERKDHVVDGLFDYFDSEVDTDERISVLAETYATTHRAFHEIGILFSINSNMFINQISFVELDMFDADYLIWSQFNGFHLWYNDTYWKERKMIRVKRLYVRKSAITLLYIDDLIYSGKIEEVNILSTDPLFLLASESFKNWKSITCLKTDEFDFSAVLAMKHFREIVITDGNMDIFSVYSLIHELLDYEAFISCAILWNYWNYPIMELNELEDELDDFLYTRIRYPHHDYYTIRHGKITIEMKIGAGKIELKRLFNRSTTDFQVIL